MIAHRRSVDAIRNAESQQQRINLLKHHMVNIVEQTPEDTTIEQHQNATVHSALADLPHEQRRALELAYFDGLTYRQVAEAMNIPEGTAKSRIRIAMQRLAESFRNADRTLLEAT
jgi:RNA polymerase sigma-70 factor (ECF subfamily)